MKDKANIVQCTDFPAEIPILPLGFGLRAFANEIGYSHTTVYNVINGVDKKVGRQTRAYIIGELWKRVGHLQPAPA